MEGHVTCVSSPLERISNSQRRDMYPNRDISVTYDHRLRRTGHPVRSAIHKPQIGRLVVGWVTTSEYLLLYVFCLFVWHCRFLCFVRNHPCCRMQPLEVTASCANGNPCNRTRNTSARQIGRAH